METGLLTLISVAVNALVAVFAPLAARRMTAQSGKLRKAEETLDLLGAGLRVVDRAVEENKDALSRTGAGNRIATTIRTYGPAAKQLVDTARNVAGTLRAEITAGCRPMPTGPAGQAETSPSSRGGSAEKEIH